MDTKTFLVILILAFMVALALPTLGKMQSDHFRVTTSVMSGGGSPMNSDSYQTEATLGQSTPLMDTADPPYSENYELYPGFWYTLEAAPIPGDCTWDRDFPDGDVDGSDLAAFTDIAFDPSELAAFASEFGRDDCLE